MDNFVRYREPTTTSSAFYSSPVTNTKTKLPYLSSLSSATKKAPASGLEEAFGATTTKAEETKKTIDADDIMNFIEEDKPAKIRKKIKKERESSNIARDLETKFKAENLNVWVKENVDSMKDSEIQPKIESEKQKEETPPKP